MAFLQRIVNGGGHVEHLRPDAVPIAERTGFDQATSPAGHQITILRA
jgi:hypothetical protein